MTNQHQGLWIINPVIWRILTRCVGVMVLMGVCMGCAFVRGEMGDPFLEDRVKELKKGQTTRQEVALRFGAPDEIVQVNDYDIFHYRRFDSKMGWLLFFSRLNVGSDHLWVFFNPQGIVEDVIFGTRTDGLEFQIWPFGE
ncbi:MAG: hypothetical protein V3T42_10155 [Nitrospirales bacterium]